MFDYDKEQMVEESSDEEPVLEAEEGSDGGDSEEVPLAELRRQGQAAEIEDGEEDEDVPVKELEKLEQAHKAEIE